MSASKQHLHAYIDRVDERTWRARQRINDPSVRRQIMEMLCASREAALHHDEHAVLHLCQQIEDRVRNARMWRIARWLSDGNAGRHPRVVAWFESMKAIEERRNA